MTVIDNASTIEIKNALYSVEAIDPGFAGVAACRVTKLVNGETYDVVLGLDGLVVCTCPSYLMTFEGTSGKCKHGKSLVVAGLLLAPISGGAPAVAEVALAAVAAPVTAMDRKRASYFGLRIPAAPTVADTDDSWENWDDSIDLPWGLGPEADPVDAGKNSHVDASLGQADHLWMGETVGLMLTGLAIDAIETEVDASDTVDALWIDLAEEHREQFRSFLRMMGEPATGWTSWLALCIQGSPVSFPAPIVEEPRPTRRGRYRPTAEEQAQAAQMFADLVVLSPRGARPIDRQERCFEELVEAGGVFAARGAF